MSDGKEQSATWPAPKFQFVVEIPDVGIGDFREGSGLDSEVDIIECRAGNHPDFSTLKIPEINKSSDVTLKKGMFKGDLARFAYFSQLNKNLIERKVVTITLLDADNSAALFVWTLKNAFPMKITSTDLNASNTEVAVEELVLAHEGMKMEAK